MRLLYQIGLLCAVSLFPLNGVFASSDTLIEKSVNDEVFKRIASAGKDPQNFVVSVRLLEGNKAACDSAITVDVRPFGQVLSTIVGEKSVEVLCGSRSLGSVKAVIDVQQYHWQAVRVIARGESFDNENVVRVLRPYHVADEALSAINGSVAKRRIRQGQVITAALIEPPKLIVRGQKISIVAEFGGVLAHLDGEAVGEGGLGDRIRVRNLRSKKIFEAVISDVDQVRVFIQ